MISASELTVAWRKSTYSSTNGGNCVEVGDQVSAVDLPVAWRKSSYSTNGGDCVEVGEDPTRAVPIRDSKDPSGPALLFAPAAWSTFIASLKRGEFRR